MNKTALFSLLLLTLLLTSCSRSDIYLANDYNQNKVFNNVTINGEVDLNNSVFDDIQSPIIAIASTPRAPTFDETLMSYGFHNDILALQDYVYINIQTPHAMKKGSPILCHMHWFPSSTNTGAINFSLNYTITQIGGIRSAPIYISAIKNATGNAKEHLLLSFPNITYSKYSDSMVLEGRLTRESASGSDTFTGLAYVDYFDCHIEKNRLGSDSEIVIYYCGNGDLDIPQGEQCDDGNEISGDGCSSICQME